MNLVGESTEIEGAITKPILFPTQVPNQEAVLSDGGTDQQEATSTQQEATPTEQEAAPSFASKL